MPAELRHIKTGGSVGFKEHKGAVTCNCSCAEMVEDVVELITLLCSPNCPHTYDGTVAGCVA